MDFSLTTLFVLPSAGTIAPAGTNSEDLTPNLLSVMGPDYKAIASGGVGSSTLPYFYIGQGRKENIPDVGTKRSDRIAKSKIISWYKVTAEPDVPLQSTIASNFQIECGQEIWFTIRAHSNYIETGFFNGLTQSVSVLAPCCNCGDNPCSTVDGAAVSAMLDKAIAKFQVAGTGQGTPNSLVNSGTTLDRSRVISSYIDIYKSADGASLIFQAKPLPVDAISCADFSLNPWMYDRLWFQVFVTKAPATTRDYETYDRCDQIATVTVTNRSLFPRGSYEEMVWLEKYYYSYQSPAFKALVRENGWNGAYESYLETGVFYDSYWVKFLSQYEFQTWDNALPQDETVCVVVPTGTLSTTVEGLLQTAFGAYTVDYSIPNRTTTTTTSTTSSTTTSTTTLVP